MTAHVTAEELMKSLPDVLSAPKTNAPIHMLCTRPARNRRLHPGRVVMTRESGVLGDFEMGQPWLALDDGRPDPRIQVSILPLRVLNLVWSDRQAVLHPGDTIIADLDTSEANLNPGCLLRAGTAVLRVSDLWNRGCAKWRSRYGNAAYAWTSAPEHKAHRLRGILCSIEQDGEAATGDLISRM